MLMAALCTILFSSLEWYHVPLKIREIIFSYYERLCAKVITKDWSTDFFPYDIGVFQGCVMSTILFDSVFNLLLDFIKSLDKLGYKMKNPADVSCMRKAYADDLTVISNRPDRLQAILDQISLWLDWSRTMKAKPKKCRALAAKVFNSEEQICLWEAHSSTVYSTFDPG